MLVGCSQCGPLGFLLCGLGIQPISSLPIWALVRILMGPKKQRSSTSIIGSSYTGNLSKPAQKRKKKRNILKIWTIQNCTLNQSSNRCCDPWFKKLGSWKLECKLLAALYGLVRLCSAFGVGDGFYYHAG